MRRAPVRWGVGALTAASHVDSYFCFQMRFFVIWGRFWSDFGRFWEAKMDVPREVFQKTSIFWKSLFFLRKIAIVKVSGLQNP